MNESPSEIADMLRNWIGSQCSFVKIHSSFDNKGQISVEKFHKDCDCTGPNVIICRSDHGYLFGVYVSFIAKGENSVSD